MILDPPYVCERTSILVKFDVDERLRLFGGEYWQGGVTAEILDPLCVYG